jgi:hypothetical protein
MHFNKKKIEEFHVIQKKTKIRDTRKELDASNYIIQDKKNENIVKYPGSINGNQFLLQNLEVSKLKERIELL